MSKSSNKIVQKGYYKSSSEGEIIEVYHVNQSFTESGCLDLIRSKVRFYLIEDPRDAWGDTPSRSNPAIWDLQDFLQEYVPFPAYNTPLYAVLNEGKEKDDV